MMTDQVQFNEWLTELAEPFWLKDSMKQGKFFDVNGFARTLLSASKPAAQDDKTIIRELQKALFYWMPSIAGQDSPAGIKAAEHSYLLYGLDDNSTDCEGDRMMASIGIRNRTLEQIEAVVQDLGCPENMDMAEFLMTLPAAPAQSGEPVEADVVPNEIAELLTEPCWNLSRRDVSDLLKRIGSILYAAPQSSQPVEAGESDDLAVDRFAAAMKEKMAAARAKGRGGWEKCSPEYLTFLLREHVEKGDPRDVANFCMMLWHHESRIFPLAAPQPSQQSRAASPQAMAIPDDCDVRKILLRVVPGDGSGHEVYARNVADVEELLSDMGERLEATATQPAQTERALTDVQVAAIMTQVQVFASSYSLIGSRFDNGDGFEHSEAMKEELRALLTAAQPASGADHAD
jgi:hypothetical protein